MPPFTARQRLPASGDRPTAAPTSAFPRAYLASLQQRASPSARPAPVGAAPRSPPSRRPSAAGGEPCRAGTPPVEPRSPSGAARLTMEPLGAASADRRRRDQQARRVRAARPSSAPRRRRAGEAVRRLILARTGARGVRQPPVSQRAVIHPCRTDRLRADQPIGRDWKRVAQRAANHRSGGCAKNRRENSTNITHMERFTYSLSKC